jgi:hypothetical protein
MRAPQRLDDIPHTSSEPAATCPALGHWDWVRQNRRARGVEWTLGRTSEQYEALDPNTPVPISDTRLSIPSGMSPGPRSRMTLGRRTRARRYKACLRSGRARAGGPRQTHHARVPHRGDGWWVRWSIASRAIIGYERERDAAPQLASVDRGFVRDGLWPATGFAGRGASDPKTAERASCF